MKEYGTVYDGCKKEDENSPLIQLPMSLGQLQELPPKAVSIVKTNNTGLRCCKGTGDKLRCRSRNDKNQCLPEGENYVRSQEACQALSSEGGGWRLCTAAELGAKGFSGNKNGVCCGTGCDYDERYVWTRQLPGDIHAFLCADMWVSED